MRSSIPLFLVLVAALLVCGASTPAPSPAKPDLRAQVFAAESSFAHTMAARDFKAFGTFIADEAIFFGGRNPSRGKEAILAAWKSFFDGPMPPFSWRPEAVEVLPSGKLAHSSGPVMGDDGKKFGVFNSIWRLEADGRWRVVFDKGCDVCDTTKAQ